MAKQDDYARITLRLPPDLHRELMALAGAGSLNALIVRALEEFSSYEASLRRSIEPGNDMQADNRELIAEDGGNDIERRIRAIMDEASQKIAGLTKTLK